MATPRNSRWTFWHRSHHLQLQANPSILSTADALEQIKVITAHCRAFIECEKSIKKRASLPWHQHVHTRNRFYNDPKPELIISTLTAINKWLAPSSSELQAKLIKDIDMFITHVKTARSPDSKAGEGEELTGLDLLGRARNPELYDEFEQKIELSFALFSLFLVGILALTLSGGGFPMVALIPLIPLALTLTIAGSLIRSIAKEQHKLKYGPARNAFKTFLVSKSSKSPQITELQRLENIESEITQIEKSEQKNETLDRVLDPIATPQTA